MDQTQLPAQEPKTEPRKKNIALYAIIGVIIVLALAVGAFYLKEKNFGGGKSVSSDQQAQSQVTLIINSGDQSQTYQVQLKDQKTVLEVLRQAAADNNFNLDIKDSENGSYLNGIADKIAGTDNKYWVYYINDEVAQLGVDKQEIKAGDKIEFKFQSFSL